MHIYAPDAHTHTHTGHTQTHTRAHRHTHHCLLDMICVVQPICRPLRRAYTQASMHAVTYTYQIASALGDKRLVSRRTERRATCGRRLKVREADRMETYRGNKGGKERRDGGTDKEIDIHRDGQIDRIRGENEGNFTWCMHVLA